MNYILKVDSDNVDKVILQLCNHDIKITNVVRASGIIHVNAKSAATLETINEIKTVKKEGFLPQLLFI
jgi:hypothetical protein